MRRQDAAARHCDASNQDVVGADPFSASFKFRANDGRLSSRCAIQFGELKR